MLKVSPPLTTYLILDISSPCIYGFFISASNKVGTTNKILGWYFLISLSNLFASNCGIKITSAENINGQHIFTTSPKQWNIGKIDKNLSPGPISLNIILACSMIALIFPFVKTIFFGVPVVPPLWSITASFSFVLLIKTSLLYKLPFSKKLYQYINFSVFLGIFTFKSFVRR